MTTLEEGGPVEPGPRAWQHEGRPCRLDVAVTAGIPGLSRSRASALIARGLVRLGGAEQLRASAKVAAGASLEVEVPPPPPAEAVAQEIPLRVVYVDDDVVVVDKPPGLVVHPGAGHADGTLVNALLHHLGALSEVGGPLRPGIVHRLDRGTSGLLVVARHDVAHAHLAAQFAAHTAGRRYLAVVYGVPGQAMGTITSHLGRHPTDRVRFASVDAEHGRHAVTHWRLLGQARGLSLIECRLETGRTHQIRVHLSEAGLPLVGDPLYGKRTAPSWLLPLLPADRPMLHAWRLRFRHPRDEAWRRFFAPLPEDLVGVLREAGLPEPREVEPRALFEG